jgi:hypothetical protein
MGDGSPDVSVVDLSKIALDPVVFQNLLSPILNRPLGRTGKGTNDVGADTNVSQQLLVASVHHVGCDAGCKRV